MTKSGGSVKLEKAWNIIQVIELQLLKEEEVRVYKVHGWRLGINNRNFLLPNDIS